MRVEYYIKAHFFHPRIWHLCGGRQKNGCEHKRPPQASQGLETRAKDNKRPSCLKRPSNLCPVFPSLAHTTRPLSEAKTTMSFIPRLAHYMAEKRERETRKLKSARLPSLGPNEINK